MGRAFSPFDIWGPDFLGRWPRLVWDRAVGAWKCGGFGPPTAQRSINLPMWLYINELRLNSRGREKSGYLVGWNDCATEVSHRGACGRARYDLHGRCGSDPEAGLGTCGTEISHPGALGGW